ncbi:TonB-linked outer membrane protein, SusC/RagA family [Mucilaginibacter mallensis]|uniref:TonB-linked outer membrane protein, SusC/RagA family n=1 Tax=Mucilaginibacter mallensis TaxID=652787 RepID=A0A1H1ZMY4_MUCMA|nr:TonB-dependent receptor [Mucilaginibacter mallensis]SDT34969.1 TonB-linked outer membrane protein, SusC/RagA family [Mucilaginibacter mallensis]
MKRKVPPKLGLLLLSCFLLLCTLQAFSQVSRSISGHITDEHGQPLPGVSVLLQGTSQGTTTDQDGFYKISASNGATLVFSYIGYDRKTLEVTAGSGGDVILAVDKKSGTLGEVVVIGYGTRQKANVTGAVSSIKGDELEKSPVANLSNAIAGAVPGLIVNTNSGEPGADDATILIRGKGTLGGGSNTTPLIVVDGVPDRSFNRLDPGDIESFTVLKDASAAIYGARAANGVILITTKRGKAGKPVLSFTSNYALTQPTRVPQMLSSWQYAQSVNEYDNLIGQKPQYTAADIQAYKDGSDPLGHPNTDWWSALMKTWTPQTNNVLSLSGGTDKIKYFISGQDLHQNSMYKSGTDYYNNDNGRVNLDIQATNNFKIGVDVLFRDEYKNGEAPGYDANGIFNQLWSDYPYLVPVYPNGKVGVGIGGGPGNSMVYVLNGDLGYTHDNYDFLQTKTSFSWALPKITSGLHLDGYFAYDDNWNQFKGFNAIPPPAYSYNSTTQQYDEYTSTVPGSLTLENTKQINKLVHLQLGYDHKFGKSAVSAFVAYEQEQQTYTELDAYRTGFLSNNVTELSAGSAQGETNNSVTTQFARQDYISRISYNYDDRYIIDYNMRYDGSSNFPAGKRFGFFPSVSAAWRISQEKFWDPNSIVDNLKLRASYGLTGNDVVASPFQYLQTYTLATGQGNGYYYGPNATQQSGLTPGATPNLNITWERSKMLNIGIDAELWHALTASVDVFHEIRYDILVPPTLSTPDYAGISLPDENLGRVQNQGIELDLGYRNKIGNFNYHINGNMTYAVNKVLYEDEPANVPSYQQKTGYPIDSWLLYKADGLYQTQAQVNASPHPNGSGPGDIKYVDVNGDGQINALDEVRTTLSPTPQIMFGTTLGGNWKNWDFTIFFQGQARAEVLVQPGGLNMAEQFFTGRWLQPGDNTYPRTFNGPTNATYGSNTYASTFWLKNDAYLRLKNLEVGYTFASSLLKSISVQSLRIYVSGNNLLTFDSLGPSFDPEAAYSNNSINGRYYPQQRVINLGANIKF